MKKKTARTSSRSTRSQATPEVLNAAERIVEEIRARRARLWKAGGGTAEGVMRFMEEKHGVDWRKAIGRKAG